MKTHKILKVISIIVWIIAYSLKTYAVEYVKKENGIILIGSKSAPFEQSFPFRISLELYSDGKNKQYAIKLSVPLKTFYAFKNNSEITFTLKTGESFTLPSLYHFYDNENSYAYIPILEQEIESMINGTTKIKFDMLQYTADDIKDVAIEEEYKKSGWEKNPTAFRMKNYNLIKQIEDSYKEINKEFKKLEKNNFAIK